MPGNCIRGCSSDSTLVRSGWPELSVPSTSVTHKDASSSAAQAKSRRRSRRPFEGVHWDAIAAMRTTPLCAFVVLMAARSALAARRTVHHHGTPLREYVTIAVPPPSWQWHFCCLLLSGSSVVVGWPAAALRCRAERRRNFGSASLGRRAVHNPFQFNSLLCCSVAP